MRFAVADNLQHVPELSVAQGHFVTSADIQGGAQLKKLSLAI